MANFGLIHGAWHGAWCWTRVIAELQALGHEARAVDLPIDRAEDDVWEKFPRPVSEN